ncbi:hypothetical protein HDR63_02200, partial [bacterium]|nr:hypothetical protein [bacterium]
MTSRTLILSIPALLCALPQVSWGAIRVGNLSRSYAASYNQVTGAPNAAAMATSDTAVPAATVPGAPVAQSTDGATDGLPVRVANAATAAMIARGDVNAPATMATLESCAAIYPGGDFAWDTPTVGLRTGGTPTCVATIEMRTRNDRGTELVLARANLATGDTVICNIEAFPESGYNITNVEDTTFPRDSEPTMDDVTRAMNNEQKKNAGLKIVAGALGGGLMGNVTGKNDPGHDSMLGTSKSKMGNSAIGALAGAAIMAGNAYGGKVAGDIILSAGVNAAAGATIGNIMSTNNSVYRVEDCEINHGQSKCLWGVVASVTPISTDEVAFYNLSTDASMVCTQVNSDGTYDSCKPATLGSLGFPHYNTVDDAIEDRFQQIQADGSVQYT